MNINVLDRKYPQTYLEALLSHFQPNCYFKSVKNSGSHLRFKGIVQRILRGVNNKLK